MLRLIVPLLVITGIVWLTFFMLSRRERRKDLTFAWQWIFSLSVAAIILLALTAVFHLGGYVRG